MKRVTTAGFRKWLAAQPPDRLVGQRGSYRSCPIATYVSDAFGYQEVVVGEYVYSSRRRGNVYVDAYRTNYAGRESLPISPALKRFISAIDRGPRGRFVPAAEALATLNEAVGTGGSA